MPRKPVQSGKQPREAKRQIFIEEKQLAKLHIAVINQAQHSRPVWIISRLSARPGLCFLCSGSWLASNQSTALFSLAFSIAALGSAARIGLGSLRNKTNMFSSVSRSSRAVLATSPSLGSTQRCFARLEGPPRLSPKSVGMQKVILFLEYLKRKAESTDSKMLKLGLFDLINRCINLD